MFSVIKVFNNGIITQLNIYKLEFNLVMRGYRGGQKPGLRPSYLFVS